MMMRIGEFDEKINNKEEMKQFLRLTYYHTICTVHQTDNFQLSAVYEILSQKQNDPSMRDLTFIGNISKLEEVKIMDMECMKASFKCCYDSRVKYILLRKSEYRKSNFIKNFNRMMKNKNEKYVFTGLKAGMLDDCVVFTIQDKTYLIQIQQSAYNVQLRPVEKIFEFKFSNINLGKIFQIEEMDKNCHDGFVISQIRQKFETRDKEMKSIVGCVQIVEKGFDKNSKNRRNLVLWVTQTLFSTTCSNEVGRCKLFLRYPLAEEENILNLIKDNHVYLFADAEITITENVNIIYSITISSTLKNHCIFKLSSDDDPKSSIDWYESIRQEGNQLYLPEIKNSLKCIHIENLFQKSINRNYIHLSVCLLQIEIIYAVIKCTYCGVEEREVQEEARLAEEMNGEKSNGYVMEDENSNFYRVNQRERKKCGHNLQVQLWGMIRGVDESGVCLISLEHRQIIHFLSLEPYLDTIHKVVHNNGRGMSIMNSNKPKGMRNATNVQEDPLLPMKTSLRYTYVDKLVVGYARTQLDKTFREGLSENQQIDYQMSFQSTKKYLQHRKIFPNGLIEKKGEELCMVPYIKAVAVLDL